MVYTSINIEKIREASYLMNDIKTKILNEFKAVYGEDGEAFFAPGRVNLIGEHTYYNGGHVFPCALTIGTYAAVRKRNDRKLRFFP